MATRFSFFLSRLLFIIITALSTFGCGHNAIIPELKYIDSLVCCNNSAEALRRLSEIDTRSLDRENTVFYTLLLTLTNYKNYVDIQSDSAINDVVIYYRDHDNKALLKRSLIAKGCAEEVIGNLDEAIKSFHQAESIYVKDDAENDAYVKLRLADLYQSQLMTSDSFAIQKYQEALRLYRVIQDKHYQIVCLGEIGGLYSDMPSKSDSALFYIESAIQLAEETQDNYFVFANYYSKSLYYLNVVGDPKRAKEAALRAITFENEIDHPRAHYCLCSAYLRLNCIDSANYYLECAPDPSSTMDSVSYLNLMSEIEEYNHNEKLSRAYFIRSNSLADSILINGLGHRLLEIEKKYDLQQVELNNVSLRSKLRGTWLFVALVLLVAGTLFHFAWRDRNRLKTKENEFNLLKDDLNSSLLSLEQLQKTIGIHEETLKKTEADYRTRLAQQEALVSSLSDEIVGFKSSLQIKEDEQMQLNKQLAVLQAKKARYDGIMPILDEQIQVIQELIHSSHELDNKRFADKFNSLMTIPDNKRVTTYWTNLHALTNDIYGNILDNAQELANGRLSMNELSLIALLCCGYTRTAIMICLKYKHVATISNMKYAIARKMGVPFLDDFIRPYQEEYRNSLK